MYNQPIIIEQPYNKNIETVWNAISQLDQIKQWFFEKITAFNLEFKNHTQFYSMTPSNLSII
jgi:uncharacterized protein YndB with AHSA1/START domain